mgnify:CR=1 FL=1
MSKLLKYINLLDQDAAAREAHNQSPQASMEQHGLNAEEQQGLMSGDHAAMAKLAGVDATELHMTQSSNGEYLKST